MARWGGKDMVAHTEGALPQWPLPTSTASIAAREGGGKSVRGTEFKRALKQVGLTVYSAAPFLGLSLSTTYRIARGEYEAPESAAKLLRLMVRLNLKPEDVP
jgi:hypothetical protein